MDEHNYTPIIQPNKESTEKQPPTSVGSWFLFVFISFVPFLNIVMLLYFALSKNTEPGLKNWATACIIWVVIGTAILSIAGIFIVRWIMGN